MDVYILIKRRNSAKTNGIKTCNSERGKHDNCRKNGKVKCNLETGKDSKWRQHGKKCNLERGTIDKSRI